MADIQSTERELTILKEKSNQLIGARRTLETTLTAQKSTASRYKSDYERAAATAKKYEEEFKDAEARVEKTSASLKEANADLEEFSRKIQEVERSVRRLTEEFNRMKGSAANSNSTPSGNRRSGGIFG